MQTFQKIISFTLVCISLVACGKKEFKVQPWTLTNTDTITTPSGLKYLVVHQTKDSLATQAKAGKTVLVHYTGFLSDGKIFDSSIERNQPIQFQLGAGMVIPGWDEGIALMKVGDKLRLIIPPNLGYGNQSAGEIPANSTLLFDVELVGVR